MTHEAEVPYMTEIVLTNIGKVTVVSTASVIYGTGFFLTPQGLNWALPNSLVHKHNLGSKS